MAAAKAAATNLEQKLKALVDAVDADAAAQVYAGAFGGLSLGELSLIHISEPTRPY